MTVTAQSLLPDSWDVPPTFRERLGESAGRQRVMRDAGHLLLVLHAPPQPDGDERGGRFFWRCPDGQWRSHNLGSGPASLRTHLEQYAAAVEKWIADAGITDLAGMKLIAEHGQPAKVVRKAAEDSGADLVVIGRSSPGPLGRLRTNSYSIIRESPCAVLSV